MLNKLIDTRDIRFVLFEMLEVDKLCEHNEFSQADREILEKVIELF